MSKKTLFTALFLSVLALFTSQTSNVAAQGPYIDNQAHYIDAGVTLTFIFDYAGDRTTVTITLVDGVKKSMGFRVYAPDKPNDQPIGRGTVGKVSCNNGDRCDSPDLTWSGGTSSPGKYIVQVFNNGPATTFQLTITSGGVTLGPSAPSQPIIYSTPYYPPTIPQYGQSYVPPYVPQYAQPYTAPQYGQPYAPQYVQLYVAPPYVPQYIQPQYMQPYVMPYDPGYAQPFIPYSRPRYVRQYYPRYVPQYIPPYYPYNIPQYAPPPSY